MRGVTQQDDASVMPALDRSPVSNVGSQDPLGWCGAEDLQNRRVPTREALEQFGVNITVPAVGRRIGTSKPVDFAEANINNAKALAVAPALAHPFRRLHRTRRCHTAPTGVAGVNRFAVIDELRADSRAQPIRANQEIGLDTLATRTDRSDFFLVLFIADNS